ncbi:hypothetical protein FACS189465_1450 [Clostridia bacterium]|nr:hypothetical protein FACS189465_1450 [Clostridia bacterium]
MAETNLGAEQNLAEALGNKEVLSQISKMDTKALNEALSSVEGIKPLTDEEAKKVIEKAAELQKASSKDIEEMLDEVSGGASLAGVKSSLGNAWEYAKNHKVKTGAAVVGTVATVASAIVIAHRVISGHWGFGSNNNSSGDGTEGEWEIVDAPSRKECPMP